MYKKGQLTLETLLWYGAALLVVLLAIGALISFGVLDLGSMLPETCDFKGSGTFKCEDYRAHVDDDQIQMQLSNKGTKSVTISAIEFIPDDNAVVDGCTTLDAPDGDSILPGKSKRVNINCTTIEDDVKINGQIEMTYTFESSTIEQVATGKFSARSS